VVLGRRDVPRFRHLWLDPGSLLRGRVSVAAVRRGRTSLWSTTARRTAAAPTSLVVDQSAQPEDRAVSEAFGRSATLQDELPDRGREGVAGQWLGNDRERSVADRDARGRIGHQVAGPGRVGPARGHHETAVGFLVEGY